MRNLSNISIGFIGVGNMSKAGLSRLLDSGMQPQNIRVTSPNIKDNEWFNIQTNKKNYQIKVASDNNELIEQCDIIILGFKPYQISEAIQNISKPGDNKFFVSIMAGININKIAVILEVDSKNILRLMPNTPCAIGQGIGASYMKPSNGIEANIKTSLVNISSAFGCPIKLSKEEELNAITAISGSGVAYVYLLCEYLLDNSKTKTLNMLSAALFDSDIITVENLIVKDFKKYMKQWAINNNINDDKAWQLVNQTFLGAYLLIENSLSKNDNCKIERLIKQLRANVTSKNGTTFAAIKTFENNHCLKNSILEIIRSNDNFIIPNSLKNNLKEIIFKAMTSAYKRSIEISK